MKHLIVNADDFGLSAGINRGIVEAHRRGVLTSTSLMVDAAGADEAAGLAPELPALSVGLHADLPEALLDQGGAAARAELERQLERFTALVGRAPTHLDSHHNVHRKPPLEPVFVEVARQAGLPLREHSAARYFAKFYGQWGGKSHLEQIAVLSLIRMLETEIADGLTELSCHPGYPDLETGYFVEREAELRTLCDPRVPQALARLEIALASYHDYPRLAGA